MSVPDIVWLSVKVIESVFVAVQVRVSVVKVFTHTTVCDVPLS